MPRAVGLYDAPNDRELFLNVDASLGTREICSRRHSREQYHGFQAKITKRSEDAETESLDCGAARGGALDGGRGSADAAGTAGQEYLF